MAYTDIDKSDDYFNTVLYTGNGSTQSITGVGFQPDWIAIKRRNAASGTQNMDSVRGAANKLAWNETSAEESPGNILTSFDSDGFSVGNSAAVNGSSDTFVSWNWLAGGTASSNTDGSITSTVSANTTSGFSIVSYTGNGTGGATVGHGLGATPSFYILKSRSTANTWYTYNKSTGATKTLPLNTTDAELSSSFANSTEPTSSVFSLGSASAFNGNGDTFIAYCFAEKKGFSKFGSYTGNNNADGPFIYTGFKPAFILIKNSTAAADWHIRDNKRDTYNASTHFLVPNSSAAEVTLGEKIDLLSNGFKIRQTGGKLNDSGNVYIYMCFSENPFVTSTGIPTTAR